MKEASDMILVTGAGGTVGSEVVEQLGAAKAPFRVGHSTKEKVKAARASGLDAVLVDYCRPDTLREAFQNLEKLFLLGPSVADQTELERNAVEAARGAGVMHIVKLSVWGAEEEAFEFGRIHRAVERAIESTGIPWTFLRPNGFMQNVVNYMGDSIRSEGEFYSAVGDARISHVDVRDIAAVAVTALTGIGHEGKAYTLSGPDALTYDEMASELSKALGRTIRHIDLPPSDLKTGMLASGIPEEIADRLLDLERYYREGEASRVTNDVREVTGREPTRFAQYARECASSLQ
jgi:uncharacterized protein YbjT (DUF2867 family)